jgi:hypothetical protein
MVHPGCTDPSGKSDPFPSVPVLIKPLMAARTGVNGISQTKDTAKLIESLFMVRTFIYVSNLLGYTRGEN